MYLLYNEHKKKTTSRRLVILARWLTHYFRDNRLCLDAEGGYFFLCIKKLFFSCLSARKKSFCFMLFCLSYPRIIYGYVCPCPALGERPKPVDSCSGQPQYVRLPWPKSLYLLLPQLHKGRE